jgi:hypothetical protein
MERMAVVDDRDRRVIKLAMLAAAGALLLGGLAADCDSHGDGGGYDGDGNDLQQAYDTGSPARQYPVVQRMSPDVSDLHTLGLVEQTHS